LLQMAGWANLAAAVALCDRVIEIETAALGADHLETATTLLAKAKALVRIGGWANLATAVALYDRVSKLRQQRWERTASRQPPRCVRRRMRWCRWAGRPTSPQR
jgi:hypothetical protein